MPHLKSEMESVVVQDDTAFTLSALRHKFQKPLTHAILNVYENHQAANNKSQIFWQSLKCFLPPALNPKAQLQTGAQVAKGLQLELCSSDQGYVALSYPWHPSMDESDSSEKYRLPASMHNVEMVRDVVLDRTFRFIRHKQKHKAMIPLWIDKLSIPQKPSPEKEIAMHSMDLVYKRCDYAIGYLWVQINTAIELDRLSALLGNRIIDHKLTGNYPTFKAVLKKKVIYGVLELLTRITSDPWWDRAWIYQEDYLAGPKMWLLLRHADGLSRPYKMPHLGDLLGELVIRSDKFREYATLFCLACDTSVSLNLIAKGQCRQIIRKAGKYNILHEHLYRRGNIRLQTSMTITILKELNNRQITKRSDLLPITANVCAYDLRVSTTGSFSLSIAILALYVANGEMFEMSDDQRDLHVDVINFLADHSIGIETPLPCGALTLIKHNRLTVDRLSLAGVHTEGMLWKLGDVIPPHRFKQGACPSYKQPSQRQFYKHGLSAYQKSRLRELCRVLNYRKTQGRHKQLYACISERLTAYLETPRRFKRQDEWPPQHSMNVMAACIVNAMDTGLYLRLARPVGRSPNQGWGIPYCGIFIQNRTALQQLGPTYVFTSWTCTREHAQGDMTSRRLAKYASIEVGVDEEMDRETVRLRSKKWINGLCFFEGEKKFPVILAWPKSLSS